jgi:hypothetical protein
MNVIGHKRPGKAFSFRLGQQKGKSVQKRLPVGVIQEYIPPFNTPDDHMLKNSCYIQASCTWHGVKYKPLLKQSQLINYVPLPPPPLHTPERVMPSALATASPL